MLIRPVQPSDVSTLSAIYRHSVLNGVASYEIEPPSEAEMASRMAVIREGGYPYVVAEIDGQVAGYAYASAFRSRPAYRFMTEDSIYLDPEFQGRGIGKALLARLIDECEAAGFRQMVAVIGGAHPASIALHRAAGFADCGRIVGSGFKFGRWLDTALMQRPLGEGISTIPDPEFRSI